MSLRVDFDAGAVIRQLTSLRGATRAIMPTAFKTFVDKTPVRSGYGKRHTSLSKNIIKADYPYAGVLDAGRGFRDGQMRGSTQHSGIGMSTHTLKTIRDEVAKFIKKITRK
jgi:hypothetical protein